MPTITRILFHSFQISKKKLKKLYRSKENDDYDKADLVVYEEVTRMPPFKRKTLVLVGVQGVGRRTLKNRLINSDQTKFGSVIPRKLNHTIHMLSVCVCVYLCWNVKPIIICYLWDLYISFLYLFPFVLI